MSRLNRAFIKAFEREPGARGSTALLDRAAREQPAPAPVQPPAEAEAPIIRVDYPTQLCLPRVVEEISLTTLRSPAPHLPFQQVVESVETTITGAVAVAQPETSNEATGAESDGKTWRPPFVYDGPTDWRSVVSRIPEPALPEVVEAAPAPSLPRDFPAAGESFRLDPSHIAPAVANQPAVDKPPVADNTFRVSLSSSVDTWSPPPLESLHAAAIPTATPTSGLTEPALQVDRFAWPSVCMNLLAQADAPFASLVDELFAGVSENRKLLAVSGYRRSAGRTTFLLSAARALAARGARVVVVDADWDTPHLAERLGVSPEVGWQDVLTGGLPLEETLIESLIDGVTLLPARPNRSRTRSINFALAQKNLEHLRQSYDFVLVDAGRLDDSTEGKIGSLLLEKMPIEGVLLVHDVSTSSLVNPAITETRLAQMQIRWWRVVENFVPPSK